MISPSILPYDTIDRANPDRLLNLVFGILIRLYNLNKTESLIIAENFRGNFNTPPAKDASAYVDQWTLPCHLHFSHCDDYSFIAVLESNIKRILDIILRKQYSLLVTGLILLGRILFFMAVFQMKVTTFATACMIYLYETFGDLNF